MYPLVSTDYQHLNVLCKYSSVIESLLRCNSRAIQLETGTAPAQHFAMLANREAAVLMFGSCSYGK